MERHLLFSRTQKERHQLKRSSKLWRTRLCNSKISSHFSWRVITSSASLLVRWETRSFCSDPRIFQLFPHANQHFCFSGEILWKTFFKVAGWVAPFISAYREIKMSRHNRIQRNFSFLCNLIEFFWTSIKKKSIKTNSRLTWQILDITTWRGRCEAEAEAYSDAPLKSDDRMLNGRGQVCAVSALKQSDVGNNWAASSPSVFL